MPLASPRALLLVLPAVIVACAAVDEMPRPKEGEAVYAQHCPACHGFPGEAAAPLIGGQRAPDLTRITERHDGTFPRALVLSKVDGYGHGSAGRVMPEFGQLLEGDTVPVDVDGTLTPTPRPLAALLAYLESVQVRGG